MTHLGQSSVMHIMLMYKSIAKVRRIKVSRNGTNLLQNNVV